MAESAAEVTRGELGVGLRRPPPPGVRAGVRVLVRRRALALVVGSWALVFAVASALRHASFNTHRFDTGNMTQAVWSTAHGRFLEATSAGGEQFTRLGAHVDPILVSFALPWRLWPSPLLLLTVEAVVLALGAVPVYRLARKHTGSERIALRFAVVYLLYPATQWNALGGFHPISLAITFLLFAIWYLDEGRLLPFALFAVLAGTTKEQVPLLVAVLGLWYAYRYRARAAGLLIGAVGLAWFAVDVLVVLPHYAPPDGSVLAQRYASIGGSPRGILETFATDPARILHRVLTPHALLFVLVLLAPLAGLSLLEPALAAGAVPGLLIVLLADKTEERSLTGHYTASVAPFLVAAAVLGTARLGPHRARRASAAALAATALFFITSPLLVVGSYVREFVSGATAARAAALRLVPADAAVSSTNELGGHLSARRRVFSVPVVREARWIVVDVDDPSIEDELDRPRFTRFLRSIERDPRWRRVFARDGVLVFRRA
jgi:uncharacterized membrane protein